MTIPNSVTSIGDYAFYECGELTSVTIPNSVTKIGDNVFSYCNRIKTVNWDSNINSSPFYYARSSIREVNIGDNVNTVYETFSEMPNLNKVVLGKNVDYLCAEAFKDCGIKEFYVTGDEAPYCYNVFEGVALNEATLYVPSDKLEYYQTTAPWSSFGNFKVTAPTAIEHVVATSPNDVSTGSVYYNINGQVVRKSSQTDSMLNDLPSGMYIVNGKKIMVK